MGIKIVSFLCGGLTGKKSAAAAADPDDENLKREYSPSKLEQDASTKPGPSPCVGGSEEHQRDTAAQSPANDEQQPLPPPPGRQQPQHLRTVSCSHHQHQRSNSAASKLVSSMSMRVLSGVGGLSRREEKPRTTGNKKLEHEDSIWKKTIILGEKCRVPDEDDDAILYDENGNRISTYHRKNNVSSMSFSRQNSWTDKNDHEEELSKK